jgi:hypothetical protein
MLFWSTETQQLLRDMFGKDGGDGPRWRATLTSPRLALVQTFVEDATSLPEPVAQRVAVALVDRLEQWANDEHADDVIVEERRAVEALIGRLPSHPARLHRYQALLAPALLAPQDLPGEGERGDTGEKWENYLKINEKKFFLIKIEKFTKK